MNREIFHRLDDKFEGKLRHYSIEKRSARLRGEDVVFSEGIAYIDALFDLGIFDHLHEPNLIGIERTLSNGENVYIIFEVIGVRPRHYEMPSLTSEVPPILKWEYLKNISESWISGGENWMEIMAVHTGYMMKTNSGELIFEKTRLSPLVGSQAHIMSENVIKEMVCKDPSEKYVDDIGVLIGYDIPLTIDIYSLFKYHTGIFGFTGSGKSNLTSLLIRKVLMKIPDIKIFIFDLSGEYTVHLLDIILSRECPVYTDEPLHKDRFAEAQVIPESVLEEVDEDELRRLMLDTSLNKITLRERSLTVGSFKRFLETCISDDKPHINTLVYRGLEVVEELPDNLDFYSVLNEEGYSDIKMGVIEVLEGIKEGLSSKSNLFKTCQSMLYTINNYTPSEKKGKVIYEIALEAVQNRSQPPITIFYIPEPKNARKAVSIFIEEVFRYKKYYGVGNKILIILDEAQEFIPDRTARDDYTYQSNLAVEMLLRQGRKYLVGGWIATQRLAHLNTNALQQLHNYFVSTLPRSYDRNVVSDAFSISRSVIDKVTTLETGEWLFVSYKATKLKNIPVEVRAYNNEEILVNALKKG